MKFYKITNEQECHHGLQYHDGLNVDILPFNPSGHCQSGGIYFSRENILDFIDYGPWIREVTIPEGEIPYEDSFQDESVKWKAHSVILGPRRRIYLDVIKELVEEGADIHSPFVTSWMIRKGVEVVKYFVEQGVDVHARRDHALRFATFNGFLEIVKYLVEQGADIHVNDDEVLRSASENGYLEIVKYLVEKGAIIRAGNDAAFYYANENGHTEVVEYLKSKIGE